MVQGGRQNLPTTKAVADSEDHIQATHSADYPTVILMACLLPPLTGEGTATTMDAGWLYGAGVQQEARQNPGVVWKPPDLTYDLLVALISTAETA